MTYDLLLSNSLSTLSLFLKLSISRDINVTADPIIINILPFTADGIKVIVAVPKGMNRIAIVNTVEKRDQGIHQLRFPEFYL